MKMGKKLQKIATLALTLIMILSVNVTGFAVEQSIAENNSEDTLVMAGTSRVTWPLCHIYDHECVHIELVLDGIDTDRFFEMLNNGYINIDFNSFFEELINDCCTNFDELEPLSSPAGPCTTCNLSWFFFSHTWRVHLVSNGICTGVIEFRDYRCNNPSCSASRTTSRDLPGCGANC